ncbi:hypothetical protein Afe04nite_04570 [Asanoa ferruginea]|nr:hypothetical protein Afe04nite_04570 [Asanoa ferruginea]
MLRQQAGQRGTDRLGRLHAGALQAQGLAADLGADQREQAFLQQQGGRVADRRQRGRGDRDRRAERQGEQQVGQGEQEPQRGDHPCPCGRWQESARGHVAEEHAQRRGDEQCRRGVRRVGDEQRLAADDQAVG